MKRILALIFLSTTLTSCAVAAEKANVIYEKAETATETVIKEKLISSGVVNSVLVFIRENFRLSRTLTILIGGEDGPLFDSKANKIVIPYTLMQVVESRFVLANYSAETGINVDDATQHTLMHMLLHELAHALIFMYDLPVVGKEEDAADSLATVLLIEFFKDGQEIAISAADSFVLLDQYIGQFKEKVFWSEHSLDIQRYYSTLCHVYGSEPRKYRHIVTTAGFSKKRMERCIEEYGRLVNSWLEILDKHLIHGNAKQPTHSATK